MQKITTSFNVFEVGDKVYPFGDIIAIQSLEVIEGDNMNQVIIGENQAVTVKESFGSPLGEYGQLLRFEEVSGLWWGGYFELDEE